MAHIGGVLVLASVHPRGGGVAVMISTRAADCDAPNRSWIVRSCRYRSSSDDNLASCRWWIRHECCKSSPSVLTNANASLTHWLTHSYLGIHRCLSHQGRQRRFGHELSTHDRSELWYALLAIDLHQEPTTTQRPHDDLYKVELALFMQQHQHQRQPIVSKWHGAELMACSNSSTVIKSGV